MTPVWPHSTPQEGRSLTLVRLSASPCPYPLFEPNQRGLGPALPPQNWMQRKEGQEVGQREVGQREVGHRERWGRGRWGRGRWDTEGGGARGGAEGGGQTEVRQEVGRGRWDTEGGREERGGARGRAEGNGTQREVGQEVEQREAGKGR